MLRIRKRSGSDSSNRFTKTKAVKTLLPTNNRYNVLQYDKDEEDESYSGHIAADNVEESTVGAIDGPHYPSSLISTRIRTKKFTNVNQSDS